MIAEEARQPIGRAGGHEADADDPDAVDGDRFVVEDPHAGCPDRPQEGCAVREFFVVAGDEKRAERYLQRRERSKQGVQIGFDAIEKVAADQGLKCQRGVLPRGRMRGTVLSR